MMNPSLDKSSATIKSVSTKFYSHFTNGQFNLPTDIHTEKELNYFVVHSL